MTLETVFNKSFRDYKKNFRITALATLLLRLLPVLIIAPLMFILVTIPYVNLTADFAESAIQHSTDVPAAEETNLLSLTGRAVSEVDETILSEMFQYLGEMALVGLRGIPFLAILWIFGIFFLITLFYAGFNNKKGKMTFAEAFKKSLHYFWKTLGLILLFYLIYILLIFGLVAVAFLLIVTIIGIVLVPFLLVGFGVLIIYLMTIWAFSIYFIFDEDCRVFVSLGKSKEFVRGRFWRVLGYILLIGVIMMVISLIFLLIGLIFTFPFGVGGSLDFMEGDFNRVQYIDFMIRQSLADNVSSHLAAILASLTTVPFTIFFFKNFYEELKEERKKKTKIRKQTGRKRK